MFKQSGCSKNFATAAMLAILPLFAACGGEEGEGVTENELTENPPRFVCYSWNDYYNDPATCGGTAPVAGSGTPPPPPPTGGTTPPPSGSGIAALINDEVESNNTLANANVMRYPTRSATITHIGWVANGSVSDMQDDVDYFSFVAPLGRDYTIRLCPPSGTQCHGTSGIDTLTVFFELLDQDGNVLLSSQAESTNVYEMAIDAGVVYYVRVMAADTMAATVGYNFQAYEKK